METIDVHGLTLDNALATIYRRIEYCYSHNIAFLEVIHGYEHGNKIKTRVSKLTGGFHPAIISVREHLNNNGISVISLKTHIY